MFLSSLHSIYIIHTVNKILFVRYRDIILQSLDHIKINIPSNINFHLYKLYTLHILIMGLTLKNVLKNKVGISTYFLIFLE